MLTLPQIEGMQVTQEASMLDACLIGRAPSLIDWGADSGDRSGIVWDTEETICGFNASPSKEATDAERAMPDGSQASVTDSEVRLPATASLRSVDRIRITKRNLVEVAEPEDWAVIGDPRIGRTAVTLTIRKIVGESVR